MLKGGPLIPIEFNTICFSKEERKTWDWYVDFCSTIITCKFDGNLYGFDRCGRFTSLHTNTGKGIWFEYKGILYMDSEEPAYYA